MWGSGYDQPPLAPGADREFSVTGNCQLTGGSEWVRMEADLTVAVENGKDPDLSDNHAESPKVPINPGT